MVFYVNETVFPEPILEALPKEVVIALTNNDKRKEFIEKGWMSWPVWVAVPELAMTVRRIILPDGYSFCATVMKGTEANNRFGEDLGKTYNYPRLSVISPGGFFKPENNSTYVLSDHLKDLRKKLVSKNKEIANQ